MSIKVLIVDDSALIRGILTRIFNDDPDLTVIGTAEDPIDAREKVKQLAPDVMTLDVEMPGMNGLDFLDRLMRLKPMPVVMVSTLTTRGASETLLALELGAVDFAAKPNAELAGGIDAFASNLCRKVKTAAKANIAARQPASAMSVQKLVTAAGPEGSIIAIGASTGGVEAVRRVLVELPIDCPPVVIAQHMPAEFTGRMADRLNEIVRLNVVEASNRLALQTGHAYIARGDYHLRVERSSGQLKCVLGQDELTSGHRPSVDVLFESVAQVAGPLGVGIILTGMGRDGAMGLMKMRNAGAHTIGQSPGSALVYGMPKVAFEEGAVVEQAPVEAISARAAAALSRLRSAA